MDSENVSREEAELLPKFASPCFRGFCRFLPPLFSFLLLGIYMCSQTLWDYVLLLVRKDRIRVLSLRYIL